MTRVERARRFAAAVAAALTLAGCATMNISSFAARGVDFTALRTYAWGSEADVATGDPRLDSNPFFRDRVRESVDQRLASRGFEKVTSGTPDLLIHYHASVRQRLDISNVDQRYGTCEDCWATVFDAGTLTIDVVDTRTNKLIWRGWAERSLDSTVDNQEEFERRVDRAVGRILERLPPAL
jgi:hypothetical protein